MIISRTPYRISFFGGGTDYPAWYQAHGGAVLATTINKYCYITCRYLPPFFEHRIRLVYSRIENCQTVDEIMHPAVRECLRFLKVDRGVEIHHDGDLPARSGMGSSSSFTVGLLHALHALQGRMPSKQQLAQESIFVEQELIKETVGSQDQVLSAYGGFNQVSFSRDGEIAVRPVTIARERLAELNAHLMLFFTGLKRTASDIAQTYVNDVAARERQLMAMSEMVKEGISVLNSGEDIGRFGALLHEAWQLKRTLSARVSNFCLEEVYQQALSAGALGGKLLGAGGGGFLVLFVRPEDQARVSAALGGLGTMIQVPFKFERSGSRVIFFDPEEDYSEQDVLRANGMRVVFREGADSWVPQGVRA